MAERLTTSQLQDLVIMYATGCGISPTIALIQVARESANFRPDVVYGPFVGGAGEKGMTQFIPDTWARFGSGPHSNAYNPDQAMGAYCRYMQYLLSLFGNDYEKALQGYNGGEGNVQRRTVSARARAYASEILAQAGGQPDIGVIDITGGSLTQTPDWLKWALIGLVGFAIWTAISD